MEQNFLLLTSNGSNPFSKESSQYMLYGTLLPFASFIGFLSNMLMVYTLMNVELPFPRTFLLLRHLLFYETLFSLNTLATTLIQPNMMNITSLLALPNFGAHEIIIHTMCIISALAFLCDRIKRKMLVVFFVVSSSLVLLLIAFYLLNYNDPDLLLKFIFIYATFFIFTAGLLIFTEVGAIYKKHNDIEVKNHFSSLSLNIARIYIFNWMAATYLLTYDFLRPFAILQLTCHLSPFYILIYLSTANDEFGAFVWNVLQCKDNGFNLILEGAEHFSDNEDEPEVASTKPEAPIKKNDEQKIK